MPSKNKDKTLIFHDLAIIAYELDSRNLTKESRFFFSIIKKAARQDADDVQVSGPNEVNEDYITYDLTLNDFNYIVMFKRKSYGAPFDISFNIRGANGRAGGLLGGYPMTGRREVFSLLNTVVDIVKDFMRNYPDVDSFSFTGAEETVAEGATEATKRTRVYNKFIERYLSRDPELQDKFKVGDLSWAGQPNVVSIRKLEDLEPEEEEITEYIEPMNH
jgi:hypothetical protein